jgi:hypothetical protein
MSMKQNQIHKKRAYAKTEQVKIFKQLYNGNPSLSCTAIFVIFLDQDLKLVY